MKRVKGNSKNILCQYLMNEKLDFSPLIIWLIARTLFPSIYDDLV